MDDPYPHVYTGPDTKWGLKQGDRCKKVRKRAGGIIIRTAAKRSFLVAPTQVQKA